MQDNIFEMKSVIFVEKFDRTKIGSQMRMMHHVEHENWVICDMGEKKNLKNSIGKYRIETSLFENCLPLTIAEW